MAGAIELTVDQRMIVKLSKLIKAEANGAFLRKQLITDLRGAVAPGVAKVQGKLRAIPSDRPGSPPLGTYLAARVRPQIRLSGRSAGVRIRIGQTPNIRGFAMAARRLNRTTWRHKVFGREVWVEQRSPIAGYFDDTLSADREVYHAAVLRACRKYARRLGERL